MGWLLSRPAGFHSANKKNSDNKCTAFRHNIQPGTELKHFSKRVERKITKLFICFVRLLLTECSGIGGETGGQGATAGATSSRAAADAERTIGRTAQKIEVGQPEPAYNTGYAQALGPHSTQIC